MCTASFAIEPRGIPGPRPGQERADLHPGRGTVDGDNPMQGDDRPTLDNPVLRRMRADEAALGLLVRLGRSADIVRIAGSHAGPCVSAARLTGATFEEHPHLRNMTKSMASFATPNTKTF